MHFSRWFLLILLAVFSNYPGVYASNNPTSSTIEINTFKEFSNWLNKDNDTTYVINFWATWCAPCVKEIPAFEKLNAQYSQKKVKVLLVSLDMPDQIDSRLLPFIEKMNMQSEVILLDEVDGNKWIPFVNDQWGGAIPATLIYNTNKRDFYRKEFTYEELEKTLLTYLINN